MTEAVGRLGRSWSALVLCAQLGCTGTLDAGHNQAPLEVSTDDASTEPSEDLPVVTEPVSGGGGAPPIEAGTPPEPTNVDPPEPAPTIVMDAGEPEPPTDAASDVDSEDIDSPLPVDRRNPMILVNDHPADNWLGELALLTASTGLIDLAGIVINSSDYSPDLEFNRSGWQELLDAAAASGLSNLPELVVDISTPLVAPDDENIDATSPNGSLGARFIVDAANTLGTPELPLVVINGSMLTDVADAYLLDPSIAERMVVVAALGWEFDGGAVVGGPNGELDTWSGVIVAQRLRFIQVSAFYDQVQDVSDARVDELPANPFGEWMASKRATITNPAAADHVALLSVVLPRFIVSAQRVGFARRNPQGEAVLEFRPNGPSWFVSEGDGAVAAAFFWELLDDPKTFNP